MALVLKDVVKKFGDKTAVDHVSFRMDKPGIFGLLGTNGAGKTTTIRMILGILSKDSGTIEWDGKNVTREAVRFGYLPEERGIYPKVRITEQLVYFAKLHGLDGKAARNAVAFWLDRLGVTEYKNTIAEQLSKGNQQKIQFITSLIHDPELIFLDEPFSGLDPINVNLFTSIIKELVEHGKYIVLSTHQMQAIEEFCHEILILKDGVTIINGDLTDIKHSYGRTNLSIKCREDIVPLAKTVDVQLAVKTADAFEFKITSDEQAYRLLEKIIEQKYKIDKFEIKEPSLHEIFVNKVGE